MTAEEAKEYVLTHLPCTMCGVVGLFDGYFHGTVRLERLVGLSAGAFGFRRLIFTLAFDGVTLAEAHPLPRHQTLMGFFRAWCAFHDFKIEREGWDAESYGQYVVWTKAPVEIKEDRRIGGV